MLSQGRKDKLRCHICWWATVNIYSDIRNREKKHDSLSLNICLRLSSQTIERKKIMSIETKLYYYL